MSARERIISIRLIEMIHKTPEYADEIGITGEMINPENVNKTKADAEKLLAEPTVNKCIVKSEEEGQLCVNMQWLILKCVKFHTE